MSRRRQFLDTPEIPIAPMIDCVFLMLVYFMTTSSLEKSEADLPFPAGRPGLASDPLPQIDEQRLAIDAAGTVLWNGSRFDMLDGSGLSPLRQRLAAFEQTCRSAGSEASLQILPDRDAPHQALVSTLDAVSLTGIEQVHLP